MRDYVNVCQNSLKYRLESKHLYKVLLYVAEELESVNCCQTSKYRDAKCKKLHAYLKKVLLEFEDVNSKSILELGKAPNMREKVLE